jgi:putative hydrolase of the HAD superfamily
MRRALLIDVDDTLFDHRHATRRALGELRAFESALAAWSVEELERRHAEILELLHAEVIAGIRTIGEARAERFSRLLSAAGAVPIPERASRVAARYRTCYEQGWQAVPGALELLTAIAGRGLPVVVVTNNGVAEQRRKLAHCGLDRHLTALVTSEEVGVGKPDRRMFDAALEAAGVDAADAVMVGDAWPTDIAGALAAGIRPVWFNRLGLVSPDPAVPELAGFDDLPRTLDVLGIRRAAERTHEPQHEASST